jgi:hypothetical protein
VKTPLLFATVTLFVASAPISAQDEPAYAVMGGGGNVLGWLGAGAEYFVLGGRASALAGIGYVPVDQEEGALPVAVGGALRGYLGSARHRGVLEASVSLQAVETAAFGPTVTESRQHYGLGVTGGYRHTTDGGVHFDVGLGVGWSFRNGKASPLSILAVGYTWRR